MESSIKTWAGRLWVLLPLLMLAGGQLWLASQLGPARHTVALTTIEGQNETLSTLKTQRLEIIGPAGRPVAVVTHAEDGSGVVVVADAAGVARAGLLSDDDGGIVRVLQGGSTDPEQVVGLSVDSEGNGVIESVTADGTGSVSLTALNKHAALFLTDTRTSSGIVLGYGPTEDPKPLVELFGQDTQTRVRLRVHDDQGQVWVWGPRGPGTSLLPTSRR